MSMSISAGSNRPPGKLDIGSEQKHQRRDQELAAWPRQAATFADLVGRSSPGHHPSSPRLEELASRVGEAIHAVYDGVAKRTAALDHPSAHVSLLKAPAAPMVLVNCGQLSQAAVLPKQPLMCPLKPGHTGMSSLVRFDAQ